MAEAISVVLRDKSGSSSENSSMIRQIDLAISDIRDAYLNGQIPVRSDGSRGMFFHYRVGRWVRKKEKSGSGPMYMAIIRSVTQRGE